jgi:hypothetical protein
MVLCGFLLHVIVINLNQVEEMVQVVEVEAHIVALDQGEVEVEVVAAIVSVVEVVVVAQVEAEAEAEAKVEAEAEAVEENQAAIIVAVEATVDDVHLPPPLPLLLSMITTNVTKTIALITTENVQETHP